MKNAYPVFSFKRLQNLLLEYFGNFNSAIKEKWLIASFLFFIFSINPFLSNTLNAKVVYASPTGAGNHDGLSWANACTILEAAPNPFSCLDLNRGEGGHAENCPAGRARCGDELWIKEGTYSVANNSDAQVGFYFNTYGGFAGNETSLAQRNPSQHVTRFVPIPGNSIFPIDSVRGGGVAIGSSYLVPGCGTELTVDGITFDHVYVQIVRASYTTFNGCTFTRAANFISEMGNFRANDCIFQYGRGLAFTGAQHRPEFNRCRFKSMTGEPEAGHGALVADMLDCRNCIFDSCVAKGGNGSGGAIFCTRDLTVYNCLFTNNSATWHGGAITSGSTSDAHIYMSTFINNMAGEGSAIFLGHYGLAANNILWNDPIITANYGTVYAKGPSATSNGQNNIASDSSTGVIIDPKLNGDYTLKSCSPAINAGSHYYLCGQSTDLAGNTRVFGDVVDIGCFEFQGNHYVPPLVHVTYQNLPSYLPHSSSICYGGTIMLRATGNAGATSYDWFNNGIEIAGVHGTLYQVTPPPGDNRYTVLEHNECNAASDVAFIHVGPLIVSPALLSATPPTGQPHLSLCPGPGVSVSANFSNGTSSFGSVDDTYSISFDGGATFQNYGRGNSVDASNATGQIQIKCSTTSGGCNLTNILVTWNLATVTPTISITSNHTSIFPGQAVTFSASTTNPGTTPVYQWKLNGADISGANGVTYIASGINDGDVYSCVLSNVNGCTTSSTANSNSIAIGFKYLDIALSSPCVNAELVMTPPPNNPAMIIWQGYFGAHNDTTFATWDPNPTVFATIPKLNSAAFVDDSGNVYMGYEDRIVKFVPGDNVGTTVIGGFGIGNNGFQVNSIVELFVGKNGTIYVADSIAQSIKYWSPPYNNWLPAYIPASKGLYGSGLNVYSSDVSGGRIARYTFGGAVATVAGQFPFPGSAANQLDHPAGFTYDAQGNLFIADAANHRIQKWAPGAITGVTVAGTGVAGNASNQLNRPTAVTVDRLGNLFITDSGNFRIQQWRLGAASGITIAGGNGRGTALNQFNDPGRAYLDTNGNIFVLDKGPGSTSRLLKFNTTINTHYSPPSSDAYFAYSYPFSFYPFATNAVPYLRSNLQGSGNQPLVAPQIAIYAHPDYKICNGSIVQFSASISNGGSNPQFQWKVNGVNAGTGDPVFVYNNAQIGDKISCTLLSNADCATPTTITSNGITMAPLVPAVSISLEGGGTTICSGQPGVFIARSEIQGPALYQWKKNGNPVGNNTPNNGYTDFDLLESDVISCVITSLVSCTGGQTATSNSIKVQLLTASIAAPPGVVCEGMSITVNTNIAASKIILQNSSGMQTQNASWDPAGVTVAGGYNNPGPGNNRLLVAPFGVYVDGDGYVYASSAAFNQIQKWAQNDTGGVVVAGTKLPLYPRGSGASDLTNPEAVFVDAFKNIYISDRGNHRVQKWAPGDTTGITVAGGNGPGMGASQLAYPMGIFVDQHGALYVCDAGNQRIQRWDAGSSIGVTVAGNPFLGNILDPDSMLFGPSAIYADDIDLYITDANRIIRWQIGAPKGQTIAGNPTVPGNGANEFNSPRGIWLDAYRNIYVCDGGNHRIQLWREGANSGTTVAGGNGLGNAPNQLFQPGALYVDGDANIYVADAGNNRIQKFRPLPFNEQRPAQEGTNILVALSFSGCASFAAPLIVQPSGPPSIFISSNNFSDTLCQGIPVTFTAYAANGGASPIYEWFKNGQPVGTNASSYTDNIINNNDIIWCALSSNAPCSAPPHVVSTPLIMKVRPAASVSITADPGNNICAGTALTFTALPVNGGPTPTYVWQKNGSKTGANSSTYTPDIINNNDVIACLLIGNGTCDAVSNSIDITITNPVTPSVGLSANPGLHICAGTNVTFSAQPVNGGAAPSYQWYLNGNPAGNNSSTFSSAILDNNDEINCIMTSNAACASSSTASSLSLTMSVDPVLTPSVSIGITGGSQTTCRGTAITFTATPVNGGAAPSYLFKVNGVPAQNGTSSTFTSSTLNNNDVVSCVLNSNAACLSQATANSNGITMTVGIPPVIICPAALSLNADAGLCTSSASIGTATAINGCGLVTISKSPAGPYPVGLTTVRWKALDVSGDSSVCTQAVTVTDNQAPSITGPATVSVYADAGHCYATNISLGTPAKGDNCGVASVTNNAPSLYPVGNTEVIWTVTDVHGLTATDTQIVLVTDTQNPTINCPSALNENADAGQCFATGLDLGAPSVNDNCAVMGVSNDAPIEYSVGFTTVTWTVTDIHGLSGTCEQRVTVIDSQNPTINCPSAVSENADAGECFATGVALGTPLTSDNCSVASVNNNAPAPYAVGNTTVAWTVTDIHGLTGTCNQTVTIIDDQVPSITCPSNVTTNADAGNCSAAVTIDVPLTSDNCGVAGFTNDFNNTMNASGTYPEGTTSIHWAITDVHELTAGCIQTVKVIDNQAPSITCPDNVNVNASEGNCSAGVTIRLPATSDNCGVFSVLNNINNSNNASGTYAVGTTTIHWTVTDIHGLSSSCNQTVAVTDNQNPVLTSPADIAVTANQSTCNKMLTIPAATASDNCGIDSIRNNFNNTANASGIYPVGITSVLWTATDVHSLIATHTQTVRVYPCIQLSASVTNTLCIGTANGSLILSVSGGHGAYTYHWSNGQTSANLTNMTAGNYSVTVNDQALGTATALYNVGTTVPAAKPATPDAISGLIKFCPNATNSYSITPVAYAASYIWTLPTGAVLQSGQGTTAISVRFPSGFSGGNISVQATNCKGTSAKTSLAVGFYTFPARPSAVTGSSTICIGSTQTYTSAAVTDAVSFTWTAPAHSNIISGQGTATVSVQYLSGFTGGNLGVFASNCLGNGATKSLSISIVPVPAKPSGISGATSICPNVFYQYLISPVANATSYNWILPANASIQGGQGTTTITVNYTGAFRSGNISVFASNCAGNGQTQNRAIAKSSTGCGTAKADETEEQGTSLEIETETVSAEFSAIVYPNPFSDQFQIRINGGSNEPVIIGIYSVDGRLLLERREEYSRSDIAIRNTLSNGMYMIQIKQRDKTKVLRLIKSQ